MTIGRDDHAREPAAADGHGDSKDHCQRCEAHLAALRFVASSGAAEPGPAACTEDVSDLTAGIVAEATAAVSLAVAASAGIRQTATAGFLAARLVRLSRAADDALTAARASDTSALRQHVRRLESLTLALWTVQAAISSPPNPVTASPPSRPLKEPSRPAPRSGLRPAGPGRPGELDQHGTAPERRGRSARAVLGRAAGHRAAATSKVPTRS